MCVGLVILLINFLQVSEKNTYINQRTVKSQDVADAMVKARYVEGLESAEFTHTIRTAEYTETKTLKLNFIDCKRQQTTSRLESGHKNARVPKDVGLTESPVREFIIKLMYILLKAMGSLADPKRVIQLTIILVSLVVLFLISVFIV